jgi:ComF family protein
MSLSNPIFKRFSAAIDAGLDCVLPRACCVCDSLGAVICQRCCEELLKPSGLRCHGCALTSGCDCNTANWAIDRTITLTTYAPPFDRLIAEMKFQSKQSICKVLGNLMGEQLRQLTQRENITVDHVCLIPVPLSPQRFRQRGFNQAFMMTQAMLKITPFVIEPRIQRTATKQSQSSLDRAQRLVNLSNAYRLNGRAPQHAILIDDVMTTGATLNTCASLLKQNGTQEVWAMVVARTER